MSLYKWFETSEPIPFSVISALMESSNLEDMAIAREILVNHYERITPSPSRAECLSFLVRFYITCMKISDDPMDDNEFESDFSFSRFEAAFELRFLFEKLALDPTLGFRKQVELIVDKISGLYLTGSKTVRNVIETGFLEHVFEIPELRLFFKHWREEPYAAGYHECLKWGDAHLRETK